LTNSPHRWGSVWSVYLCLNYAGSNIVVFSFYVQSSLLHWKYSIELVYDAPHEEGVRVAAMMQNDSSNWLWLIIVWLWTFISSHKHLLFVAGVGVFIYWGVQKLVEDAMTNVIAKSVVPVLADVSERLDDLTEKLDELSGRVDDLSDD